MACTLCECGGDNPLVTLFGMRMGQRGSVSSKQGGARWQSTARREPVEGHRRFARGRKRCTQT
jgi:hypothetical protein